MNVNIYPGRPRVTFNRALYGQSEQARAKRRELALTAAVQRLALNASHDVAESGTQRERALLKAVAKLSAKEGVAR